jgi:hypothetical protein
MNAMCMTAVNTTAVNVRVGSVTPAVGGGRALVNVGWPGRRGGEWALGKGCAQGAAIVPGYPLIVT